MSATRNPPYSSRIVEAGVRDANSGRIGVADPSSSFRNLVDDRPRCPRGTQGISLPFPLGGSCRFDERRRISVQPRLQRVRRHRCDAFGLLRLGRGEIGGPIDPEHRCNVVVRPVGQQRQPPAKQRRRKPQGGDGVAGVVLAIPERPLAVLPRFPPVNRSQPDQKAGRRTRERRPRLLAQNGSLFEPMLERGVVEHPAITDKV
jgi:hypothetical protein